MRVIIAETSSGQRNEYVDVLKGLGCTDIIETGNIKDVNAALEEGGVDLLIGDATLPESDLSQVVYDIRHNQIGDNPFIIAMMLVSDSDKELIGRVIDSGADDVLVKPLDAQTFRDRLLMFTRGRRPFVVTSEYIGPDRLIESRKGSLQVPLIKAPNPLLVRVGSGHGSGVMKRAVDRAMVVVNEQKVERHAYSIHWLMERLVAVENGDLPASELNMAEQLVRLNDVAQDLSYRLDGTTYQHAAEMCMTLEQMTYLLKKTPELAGQEEISLLCKLTLVIKRKCNGNCAAEDVPPISVTMPNYGALAPMAAASVA